MTQTASVVLPDGTTDSAASVYGVTVPLERPGAFRAEMILSPINRRIQLLDYAGPDVAALLAALKQVAARNEYGKIWVKARASEAEPFLANGFVKEATIPGFFHGEEDAHILAQFLTDFRCQWQHEAEQRALLDTARTGGRGGEPKPLPADYTTSLFTDADAEDLAVLYGTVFATYPFPIDDPEYLRETAKSHIIYRLIRNGDGKLVGAASAETSPELHNSEMTDFAVLPSERGKGLAYWLLRTLERDAAEKFGTRCYYTIARATQVGIMRIFHKAGYDLTGTLVNNCSIGGQFETMHVMTLPQK
ncbi:MAG: putative beta-lysine N-acetyltransferase [Sumerlaeia bacterium]